MIHPIFPCNCVSLLVFFLSVLVFLFFFLPAYCTFVFHLLYIGETGAMKSECPSRDRTIDIVRRTLFRDREPKRGTRGEEEHERRPELRKPQEKEKNGWTIGTDVRAGQASLILRNVDIGNCRKKSVLKSEWITADNGAVINAARTYRKVNSTTQFHPCLYI